MLTRSISIHRASSRRPQRAPRGPEKPRLTSAAARRSFSGRLAHTHLELLVRNFGTHILFGSNEADGAFRITTCAQSFEQVAALRVSPPSRPSKDLKSARLWCRSASSEASWLVCISRCAKARSDSHSAKISALTTTVIDHGPGEEIGAFRALVRAAAKLGGADRPLITPLLVACAA